MKWKVGILFFLVSLFWIFPLSSVMGEEEKIGYLTVRVLDDGKVEESVKITGTNVDLDGIYDGNSQIKEEEEEQMVKRSVPSIEDYIELDNAFPLEVQVKKHILWDNYIIKVNYGKNKLVDELTANADKIVFSLQIPGIINETSADRKEGNTLVWTISSKERPNIYVNALVIDGFRLALFILGIGVLLAFGYFISAVLKVNRIIEEEYSLETAKMPETEENKQR